MSKPKRPRNSWKSIYRNKELNIRRKQQRVEGSCLGEEEIKSRESRGGIGCLSL